MSEAEAWFATQGWQPHAFQREVWAALAQGRSGLLHATTGSGKTYAVWLGALQRRAATPHLQCLWITPMRALAADTARALQRPLSDLAPGWTVAMRTGDTPSAERVRQDRKPPPVLVTTPESLSLLLSRDDARARLSRVHTVVVDEWHELIGTKRGVQVQLALARLRRWNPALAIWGLSATLGNLDESMATLVGQGDEAAAARAPCLVRGRLDKPLLIDCLLPPEPGRFSWGGHLGAQMLQPVVRELEQGGTTLVFTNVRSQAETWYQLILAERPEWAGQIAVHHGSLDKSVREWVEDGLKQGTLRAVIATSSLDLGVDFLPVERVLQIGSAKGVARLLQRAGRSGHAPGRASRVTLVPTQSMELVEAAAVRAAALAGRVESRVNPEAPLDVLVQHIVTVALGGGFEADALFDEVRTAPAYATLSREAFDWALDFCAQGGRSLAAYPDYHRIGWVADEGRWRVTDRGIALRHRLQVGTIVSDATMQLKWLSGVGLGSVEEGFIARLKPGDCFVFAGRVLEYVRTQDMAAYVRKSDKRKGIVPAWAGSKMALSGELADAVLALLHAAAQGQWDALLQEPEMRAAQPMLLAQQRLSALPSPGELLVEQLRSREGHHLFVYPSAGRQMHMGLAQLLAWRLGQREPNTFSISINDYGLELLSAKPVSATCLADDPGLLASGPELLTDVLESLNSGELAQRRFREIARVAGLVFSGYPGAPKSMKQLQASSSLFYEVFRKYDSDNRLLQQAQQEVLAQELELQRLRGTLARLQCLRLHTCVLAAPSPLALALMVERFREALSTEQLKDRLDRLLAQAEAQLDRP
ncbi:MAG: ligase-associated DNA damage response DEXH box helicase [Rubrivivax sp.]|nr:ligase-associated DNA damage response DEXH box helicase [Rubrivivax sp.]